MVCAPSRLDTIKKKKNPKRRHTPPYSSQQKQKAFIQNRKGNSTKKEH